MKKEFAKEDVPFLLTYPNLDDPDGVVLLSNRYAVLQRLMVPAGEWEGVHSHPGNQLYVQITSGEWSGRLGDEIEYWKEPEEAGSVGWVEKIPLSKQHDSGNTGNSDMELIYVTLKEPEPINSGSGCEPQVYPTITLEPLFENHRLIAQRIELKPGQWSGMHSRPGNQILIHISGGILEERGQGLDSKRGCTYTPGSAEWLDVAADHEIGNVGEASMNMVLVTLK